MGVLTNHPENNGLLFVSIINKEQLDQATTETRHRMFFCYLQIMHVQRCREIEYQNKFQRSKGNNSDLTLT